MGFRSVSSEWSMFPITSSPSQSSASGRQRYSDYYGTCYGTQYNISDHLGLILRPSLPPVFDRLQCAKTERGLVNLTTDLWHTWCYRFQTQRHIHTSISSYRWTRETRQVPAERPVLSLEHNQVWNRTAKGCSAASIANSKVASVLLC